mmetsp:Transcript_19492/g.22318  ORF Transcript_19492/g.22318 Transcript_19492/m.22318 type:complete len:293 (+) Transcript_19492:171-1049(+)
MSTIVATNSSSFSSRLSAVKAGRSIVQFRSRPRSDSMNTVVTSNASPSKKRERTKAAVFQMLRTIHPTDYARAAFKANGCADFEAINHTSLSQFQAPTPEMIDAYGTDIVMAVRNNNVEKARQLFHDGAFDCNACNRFSESILHIACRRGNFAMVQFLITEVGLKVHEIRDDYHRTPLHDAFWTSTASYDVVDFLLQQPHVVELLLLKDIRGCTPLDYARAEDRGKWLRFLWERKAILRTTPSAATATTAMKSTPVSNIITIANVMKQEVVVSSPLPPTQIFKRQRLCSVSQ